MSEGMGDGGLECVLASWDTKPESWEETLLSRWAPAEGIWRRLKHNKPVNLHYLLTYTFTTLNPFPTRMTEPFVYECESVFTLTAMWGGILPKRGQHNKKSVIRFSEGIIKIIHIKPKIRPTVQSQRGLYLWQPWQAAFHIKTHPVEYSARCNCWHTVIFVTDRQLFGCNWLSHLAAKHIHQFLTAHTWPIQTAEPPNCDWSVISFRHGWYFSFPEKKLFQHAGLCWTPHIWNAHY